MQDLIDTDVSGLSILQEEASVSVRTVHALNEAENGIGNGPRVGASGHAANVNPIAKFGRRRRRNLLKRLCCEYRGRSDQSDAMA